MIDYEGDARTAAPNSDALRRVTELAALMRAQQARVDGLQVELQAARDALMRTEREDLPALMTELNLSELTLKDGTRLVVTEDVAAAVSEGSMPAAVRWLTERGYDGIVKCRVTADFGRGERALAAEAARAVHQHTGHDASVALSIAPQTLRAFIRERLAAGEAVPFDLFGVHPYSRAQLKEPRKTR